MIVIMEFLEHPIEDLDKAKSHADQMADWSMADWSMAGRLVVVQAIWTNFLG